MYLYYIYKKHFLYIYFSSIEKFKFLREDRNNPPRQGGKGGKKNGKRMRAPGLNGLFVSGWNEELQANHGSRGRRRPRIRARGHMTPREELKERQGRGRRPKQWTGGAQGRTKEGANATIAPPRGISLGNSEG
jgi:hypothetical protein